MSPLVIWGVIDTATPEGRLAGELMACRNAFGSIGDAKVQERDRQSHQDAGGSGRGRSDAQPDDGPKIPKELKVNPEQQEHYRYSIDKGLYKGWDDPQLLKEMKYVKTGRRAVQ